MCGLQKRVFGRCHGVAFYMAGAIFCWECVVGDPFYWWQGRWIRHALPSPVRSKAPPFSDPQEATSARPGSWHWVAVGTLWWTCDKCDFKVYAMRSQIPTPILAPDPNVWLTNMASVTRMLPLLSIAISLACFFRKSGLNSCTWYKRIIRSRCFLWYQLVALSNLRMNKPVARTRFGPFFGHVLHGLSTPHALPPLFKMGLYLYDWPRQGYVDKGACSVAATHKPPMLLVSLCLASLV